jgi:hypothetical protein
MDRTSATRLKVGDRIYLIEIFDYPGKPESAHWIPARPSELRSKKAVARARIVTLYTIREFYQRAYKLLDITCVEGDSFQLTPQTILALAPEED